MVQVFMALLLNALDAMEDKGVITLRTRTDASGATTIAEVIDRGHGIRGADRTKIFEPFFTTKAPSRGTGLGLSICYAIVTEHGGRIEVDSVGRRGERVPHSSSGGGNDEQHDSRPDAARACVGRHAAEPRHSRARRRRRRESRADSVHVPARPRPPRGVRRRRQGGAASAARRGVRRRARRHRDAGDGRARDAAANCAPNPIRRRSSSSPATAPSRPRSPR